MVVGDEAYDTRGPHSFLKETEAHGIKGAGHRETESNKKGNLQHLVTETCEGSLRQKAQRSLMATGLLGRSRGNIIIEEEIKSRQVWTVTRDTLCCS